MKIIFPVLLAAAILSGCTPTDVARRDGDRRHVAYVARHDYFQERQTITGSNIPIPRDQLPAGPVSADTPRESVDRSAPSLYPTEPVVGATRNTEPGTEPVNVGAGPAGSNPLPSGR